MAYLGNWALFAPIIIVRFLLNNHPFLLEAIGATISVYSFPSTFDIRGVPSPKCGALHSPFCAICKKGNQFQESILCKLHEHSFSNIIYNMASNSYHMWLRFYVGLGAHIYFFACQVIPSFCLVSNVFSFVLCTNLGLPHPLAIGFIQCICDYGLDLVGTHLFRYSHGEEQITSHNAFQDAFAFIMKDVGFHVLHEQIHVCPLPYFESFHQ